MDEIKNLYIEQKNKYDRYTSELEDVEARLRAYGTGLASIVVKSIDQKKYYYKQWRDGDKTKSQIIGKAEPSVAADVENEIVARKARASFVSRHTKYRRSQQDEHDRFMPMWFNGINMPVNIKD